MKRFVSLILLGLFLVLLSACAKDNTPPPTPLSKIAPTDLKLKIVWSTNASDGADDTYLTLGSALNNNVLVTAGVDGSVVAMNADNGKILWQQKLPVKITSTPAVNDNYVFVTTIDGYLYALNQKNGKQVWKMSLPSMVLSAPTATNDVVVVAAHDATVEAFAADTGRMLWSWDGNVPALTLYGNASPLIYNNKVYVGFANGQLIALDLYQGLSQWQVPVALPSSPNAVGSMVDVDATPLEDNDVIFTVAYHGSLMALNSSDGKLLWEHPDFSAFETPAIDSNRIVVTDDSGRVFAFDESSGQELWMQQALRYRFVSPPTIINNWVVLGDYEGFVHFLSLDQGKALARIQVDSKGIRAQPLIYNNSVIVTTNRGSVVALTASAQ